MTSNGVNPNHEKAAPCPHCVGANNQARDNKAFGEKLRAYLGVCGCLSCYVAMFPALLLGVVGVFGLSNTQTINALNAYMGSMLFQPILVISILFLIISLLRYGKIPLTLSIIAGLGIFVSMNFYMTGWFFTLSFGVLAIAYYLAFQQSKAQSLKIALALLIAVVVLGVIDIGRPVFSAPPSSDSALPAATPPAITPPAATPHNIMDMMQ